MRFLMLLLSAVIGLSGPASVKTQLDWLRERFQVVFVYDAAIEPEKIPAPKTLSGASLEACLDELLLHTEIVYAVRGRTVVLYRRTVADSLRRYDDVLRASLIRSGRMFRDAPGTVPVNPNPFVPMLLGAADPLKLAPLSSGVVPTTEGSATLVVRGGEPDGNLILMDGTPLYSATHLLGYLSVFDGDALSRIRMYKGHFPAQYGGRASGVIDAEGRDGAADRLHGTVGTGIVTTKLLLEGPVGKKTSFLLNGRAFSPWIVKTALSILFPGFAGDDLPADYNFYDLYGRLTHDFSEKDRLRLTFFRSGDRMSANLEQGGPDKTVTVGGRYGTTLASAAWHRTFSSSTEGTIRLSWQHFASGDDVSSSAIRDWQAAFDASTHSGGRHMFRWGGGCSFHDLMSVAAVRSRQVVSDVSVYAEDEWRSGRWTAVAGARLNRYAVPGKTYVSVQPRLFLQFVPPGWRFHVSAGRMAQPLHALTSSRWLTLPSDLWVGLSDRVSPMTSDQFSIGAEYRGAVSVTAEWWHRRMEGVLEYRDFRAGHLSSGPWENDVVSGHGDADGLEVSLAGPSVWQVSYTLSRSRRRFDEIDGGKWFPSVHDHRHSLALSLHHDLTPHAAIHGLWTYQSGGYMTALSHYSFEMTPEGNFQELPVYEGRNNVRLPDSHRLDLGAAFHWEGKRATHRLTAGIYNVYAAKNPSVVLMEYVHIYHSSGTRYDSPIEVNAFSLFRLLPYVSYSLSF